MDLFKVLITILKVLVILFNFHFTVSKTIPSLFLVSLLAKLNHHLFFIYPMITKQIIKHNHQEISSQIFEEIDQNL